ncbi:dehydrogenase/reductase SDR family member on chromosome X isoform X2 [Haemorhous mexicanus]|uniref:dehydrogenase/reductase SDR family member on chromosome X isoform X2 n=1 Tax=Haemorhous mexicanus TaxID=30427 RepID=UPI0028BEEB0A|nr:dehydrogenase/reductase SDR family member on chromosome X isoform X2 [Haemorhous mexicanus]
MPRRAGAAASQGAAVTAAALSLPWVGGGRAAPPGPAWPGPAETLRRPPARPVPSPPRPEPAAAAGREAAMSLLSALVPLLRVYCIGLRVILHQLRRRFQPRCAPASAFPTQNGKVAIVTGGTKGIGYQTVKHLARLGMHVIIAGNSESDGQEAVRKIKEETLTGKVEFLYCDLASMKSIRQFVQQFRARNCPLHVLVNNAGVMLVPERKTEDGFEEHFGLNYLGHFLLTNLLLDTLKQSGTHSHNARIITVSSATHYVGKLHLNDLQSRCSYSPHGAYAQSKLALVLFTYRLQHLLTANGSHVTANVVDPGVVNTELYKHVFWVVKVVKWMTAWLFFKGIVIVLLYQDKSAIRRTYLSLTPEEGASTTIYAAVSPEVEGAGGCYFYNEERTKSADVAYDEELQRRLWTESCKMVGISDEASRLP